MQVRGKIEREAREYGVWGWSPSRVQGQSWWLLLMSSGMNAVVLFVLCNVVDTHVLH